MLPVSSLNVNIFDKSYTMIEVIFVHYFLSAKRSIRLNMVVVQGICFCWCIIGKSGVHDSKSNATRLQTKVSQVKIS